MGFLCNQFEIGCTFKEYLELGETHPETGENLFVGIHADGKGATLLTEIPENASTGGEWISFAEGANSKISGEIITPVQDAFCAYKEFIGSSPELTDAASRLDLLTPDYADVFYADTVADIVGRNAAEKSLRAGSDEASAVYADIANDMQGLRERLATVMEGPEYSTLIKVDHGLSDMNFDPQTIRDLNIGSSDAGVTGIEPCEPRFETMMPPQ